MFTRFNLRLNFLSKIKLQSIKRQYLTPQLISTINFNQTLFNRTHIRCFNGQVKENSFFNEFREFAKGEIRCLNNYLINRINQSVLLAKEKDKKLLVMIGEDIIDKRSLAIELIVIKILLTKHQMQNLLIKSGKDFLDTMRTEGISTSNLNVRKLVKEADKLNINIIPLSKEHFSYNQLKEDIKNTLLNLNDNVLLVLSKDDLSFFDHDNDLKSAYEFLQIDTSSKLIGSMSDLMMLSEDNWSMPPSKKLNADYLYIEFSNLITRMPVNELIEDCLTIEM